MSLKQYKLKRNFNKTNEPSGTKKCMNKNTKNKNEKTTNKNTKNKKIKTETKTLKNKNNKTKKDIKTNKLKTKNEKATKSKKKKLIFVVQHHFARREHYDFRLEHNGVLLSWAVPKGLSMQANEKRLAVHVEDHPLEYAKFEGIIPAGNYGAGSVEIFDSGTYLPSYDLNYGIKKGHIKFVLFGNIFKGEFSLIKLDEKNWLIIKGQDEFANLPEKNLKNEKNTSKNTKNLKISSKNLKNEKFLKQNDNLNKKKIDEKLNNEILNLKANAKNLKQNDKVNKNLNNENLKQKKDKLNVQSELPFNKCDVQLASLTNKIPSGNNWLFEIKYDGYRMLAFKQNDEIKIFSRNNKDYTKRFAALSESLKKIDAQNFVLDGEVVAFDSVGRSEFSLLLDNIKTGGEIAYVLFDILALNGKDLRNLPLLKRKQILKELLPTKNKILMFSEHLLNKGNQCFEFAKQHNLEGVVAKDINSTYAGKRNEDWLKIKCYNRQEFVICGFTTTAKNQVLSALLLGVFSNKKLIYVGKVGTGFDENEKQNLRKSLNKILINIPHFNLKSKEQIFWVKPKLVAEIQFAELTKDNILRQPSFVGLREDKSAKNVVLEANKN